MDQFSLKTNARFEMIDITDRVSSLVRESKVRSGVCHVFVPHTTAAVTINENADPDVQHDLLEKLSRLIPQEENFYQHGEGNSDSHLKSSLVGCTQTVLVERGKLALGTWQGIYFCEFDGPRSRQCWLKLVAFS